MISLASGQEYVHRRRRMIITYSWTTGILQGFIDKGSNLKLYRQRIPIMVILSNLSHVNDHWAP